MVETIRTEDDGLGRDRIDGDADALLLAVNFSEDLLRLNNACIDLLRGRGRIARSRNDDLHLCGRPVRYGNAERVVGRTHVTNIRIGDLKINGGGVVAFADLRLVEHVRTIVVRSILLDHRGLTVIQGKGNVVLAGNQRLKSNIDLIGIGCPHVICTGVLNKVHRDLGDGGKTGARIVLHVSNDRRPVIAFGHLGNIGLVGIVGLSAGIVDDERVGIDTIRGVDDLVRCVRMICKDRIPVSHLDVIVARIQIERCNTVCVGHGRRAKAAFSHNTHLDHQVRNGIAVLVRDRDGVSALSRLGIFAGIFTGIPGVFTRLFRAGIFRIGIIFRGRACSEHRAEQRKTEQHTDQQRCLKSFAHNLPPKIFSLPARKREKSKNNSPAYTVWYA